MNARANSARHATVIVRQKLVLESPAHAVPLHVMDVPVMNGAATIAAWTLDAATRDAAKAAAVMLDMGMRDIVMHAVRIPVTGKTVAAKAGHRVVRAVRALPLLTPDVLAQYAALHADQLRA